MGEVITKNAAVDDILSDARTTLERAKARGGAWKEDAEKRFEPVLAVVGSISTRLEEAKKKLVPLEAAVRVVDERADDLLHRIHDEVWNLLGRPANDPLFQVLFPDGAGGLVEDDRDGQPARMELVAALFAGKVHPRIPAAKATEYAEVVTLEAKALQEANSAIAAPRTEAKQLERIRAALARTARVELTRFKRTMLGEGFSEADVHTVIPDRPRGAGSPKATEPAAPTG